MAEIPQIISNGSISVPNAPRVPQGGAFEPLVAGSEDLAWIARNAMRDEEVGQVSSAIGDFMLRRNAIEGKLANVTNPDGYLSDYTRALNAARDDILKGFSAGPMRDKLAGELNIHLADTLHTATLHSVDLQVRAGQDAIKTALSTYAPLAATSPEQKDRDYAVGQAFGLIHGNKYTTDAEKSLQWNEFNKNVDVMGLQHQISTDPSTAMIALSASGFDKAHPLILPEEKAQLQSQADTALRLPMAQLEAQHAAASAQVLNKLLVNAHNGNLNPGDVQHAYDAGFLNESEFKWLLPGQKPTEPSDLALIKSVKAEIDNNPEGMSRYDILALRANPKDTAIMLAYQSNAQQQNKKTINASALQLGARLRNEIFKPSMVVLNPKAREAEISQFNSDWRSFVETARTPKDLYDAADQMRKIYGRGGGVKKPPPPLPGETDAAYGARIRAAGGIF